MHFRKQPAWQYDKTQNTSSIMPLIFLIWSIIKFTMLSVSKVKRFSLYHYIINCYNTAQTCPSTHAKCRDGIQCFPLRDLCDGDNTYCLDQSDEDPDFCRGKGWTFIYYHLIHMYVRWENTTNKIDMQMLPFEYGLLILKVISIS